MSAYRVTLLDCDLCGEVFDPGPEGIGASFRDVRRVAANHYGWSSDWTGTNPRRSWRNVDICPKHADLTMPEALRAAEERLNPKEDR